MKLKRLVCVLLLAALCVGAWGIRAAKISETNKTYTQLISSAKSFCEDGLYQRALTNLNKAMALRDSVELREQLLQTSRSAMDDGVLKSARYVAALVSACTAFPEHIDFWKLAITEIYALEDYKTGYQLLQKMPETALKIRYTFRPAARLYSAVSRSPDGYATVCYSDSWGLLAPDGDDVYSTDYNYLSPVNAALDILICTDSSQRLTDSDGVVQSLVRTEFSSARAYGNDRIPLSESECWFYYDCTRHTRSKLYQDASSFQDGVAAVRENDVWTLIDPEGQAVSGLTFRDIKLYENGQYSYQNRSIASEDGLAYRIYDAKWKPVGDFTARDMDVFLGEPIAFCDESGLWGFVSESGKVLIEPTYQAAKSFSGSLAAVLIDGQWGFINRDGELAIAPQFAEAGYFSADGICFVGDAPDALYKITLRFPVEK